ncbi:MAG: M48 family metallopeptidase [Haliscomenobacter sp.]|nr:M48 family metallopeptidase [Haliscomenobacter sp.]MBK7478011.1 M48 family metallopeptidase [Haliscomenobacter sp.]MBK8878305.1 M48 family metallopeptidase [Haliscomenobacter sp.]
MKKSEKTTLKLQLNGQWVQVQAIQERRASLRAATGRQGLIFRMPLGLSESQRRQAWEWFHQWALTALQKQPELLSRARGKEYRDGDLLQVGSRVYRLALEFSARQTHTGRLLPGNEIRLHLVETGDDFSRNQAVKTLLSRLIAKDFFPEVNRRVHELNHLFFKAPIQGIRLKYLSSKWGSCSSRGNINLSTRLLFAPQEVVDYVIVHELAHLMEMNHSDRFWKIVREAMPGYKEQERWLKAHGGACDF